MIYLAIFFLVMSVYGFVASMVELSKDKYLDYNLLMLTSIVALVVGLSALSGVL